jgi:hypothetical protein
MTSVLIGAALAVVIVAAVVGITASAKRKSGQNRTRPDGSHPGALDAFGVQLEAAPHDETEDERRLRKLREFQRAEKIREAAEEAELATRAAELSAEARDQLEQEQEDEQSARMRKLREFQRAEKVREAAEELEIHGPEPEVEQPIGTLVTQEVMEMRREEEQFRNRRQEDLDRAEVSRVVGEARDLVVDMNAQYGWQPGEPSIPDRMFNTDIETVLGTAISRGKVDFRTHRMVATMRSFARAQTGGRTELAKVMATRVLLGSGRLTEEELAKLNGARRLFGDDFAEAAGFVDHMTREQERIQAKKLGLAASRARSQDRGDDFGIERDHQG